MPGMLYEVEHQTRYVHAGRVSTSRHLGYLTPRTLPRQAVHQHTIRDRPYPAEHVLAPMPLATASRSSRS